MVKLPVPYRSQWAADAANHSADCGPTCVAMILNYRGVEMSPDKVYSFIAAPKESDDYTTFTELILAVRDNGAKLNYRAYEDGDEAFRNLKANLDAGNPAVALVKYLPWKATLGNWFDGGHFVVVTGYGGDHIFLHDPLFGMWEVPAERGAHYTMGNDLFAAGWGGFPVDENPNWAVAYNGDVVEVDATPAPVPQPVPTPDVPAEPTPSPIPTPTAPANTMDDVNRRIRALAAYRWTEPPDFGDPAKMQIWLDNLGDFALGYDKYQVQSGDSLTALAARFFADQTRWPAIKAYNNLARNGLWLGETLLIPSLGQDGKHRSSALPSDTVDFSAGLEALDGPTQDPLDYNELVGESSKGIGFVDLPDA